MYSRLLPNMCTNQKLRFRWNSEFSELFSVTNGVKQRGVISPILFCVYMDSLLNELADSSLCCHMIRVLRARSVHIHSYIDDWLIKNYKINLLNQHAMEEVNLSIKLGWILNFTKSDLVASQYPNYVGVQYDLKLGIAKPSITKLKEWEQSIIQTDIQTERIFKQKGGTARIWASLIGKMVSMSKQISLGSLHRHPIQRSLQTQWNQRLGNWENFIVMRKFSHLDNS